MGIKASNTAEVYFDDVKIPRENLLGGMFCDSLFSLLIMAWMFDLFCVASTLPLPCQLFGPFFVAEIQQNISDLSCLVYAGIPQINKLPQHLVYG